MLKSVNHFNLERAMKQELGKKESFNLKKHFKNESSDFTPWLAENLDEISKEINVKLINPSTEQSSENFKVDIEAELEDGSKVVIENQFGSSDHDHLGKIITYRTAHNAKVAIWIVEEARQEHIDSINWLNETDNGCDFYLLEAKLIKIGDSLLALDVNKVASPSNEIREKGKIRTKDARRFEMREKFWDALFNDIEANSSLKNVFKKAKDGTRNYIHSKPIVKGVTWSIEISQSDVRCRVYIYKGKNTNKENLEIFNRIIEDRKEIEKTFGEKLEWISLDNQSARVIDHSIPGGWGDPEENWPGIVKKDIEVLNRFIAATKKSLAKLKE